MLKEHPSVLCFVVVLTLWMGVGLAQDSSETYTQVGFWDVPREKTPAFVAYFEKSQKPVLERLLAEGVIVEWGFEAQGLHDPDGYSHAIWFSAPSLAGLEKVVDSYYASLGNAMAEREAELAGLITKHADFVARSQFYGSRHSRMSGGYSFGSSIRVKRGKGAEFRRAWGEWAKPVYERLLSDGTIVAYVLDVAHYHTSEDSLGRHWSWYVVEDMEAEEKVEAAFDAAREKLSEAERETRRTHYWDMVVPESHRDAFTRLIYFQTK